MGREKEGKRKKYGVRGGREEEQGKSQRLQGNVV